MTKNDSKRNKPDDNLSPDHDVSNNELARMISNQGKTTQGQIDQLGKDLRDELKQGLGEIKQELNDVRANLNRIKLDVHENTDAIARAKLANDLIISGVPFTTGEDLYGCYRSWQPLRDGNNCLILLQFAITNQRNDFFGRYLGSRSLTLRQAGFQSDGRVFVNENLTPAARRIKAKAIDLKKEGKLSTVYSRSGVVHVKTAESDETFPIKAEQELLEFRR
ncbi:hypothetical protein quinque_002422 [Culex quinquefasciatus]